MPESREGASHTGDPQGQDQGGDRKQSPVGSDTTKGASFYNGLLAADYIARAALVLDGPHE